MFKIPVDATHVSAGNGGVIAFGEADDEHARSIFRCLPGPCCPNIRRTPGEDGGMTARRRVSTGFHN